MGNARRALYAVLYISIRIHSIYPGLYMIGYGKGKIILKFPPFFRLNEENQELENSKHQMKIKTKSFCFHLILNFPLLIFLVQSEERREFQNNISFSVPYHIQAWYVLLPYSMISVPLFQKGLGYNTNKIQTLFKIILPT